MRRVVVTVSGDDAAVFSAPSVVDDADTSLKRSLVLTAELVVALCARLDSREKADQVGKDMAVLVQDCNDQTDAEETVRQFISLLGEEKDSRTIRVLKTINQDLVAHCTCELKEHITSRFMTKDVRTPEGWRIVIQLPKEEAGAGIQVVHTRREQSIDLGGDVRNHWEFEWELKLLLDSGAGEMKQAQLRVTDLFLSETIDPKLESQIKHDLRVGENII